MCLNKLVLKTMLVVLFAIFAPTNTHAANKKIYVINIASSQNNFNVTHLPKIGIDRKLRFYTVQFKYKEKTFNRLRLGFFNTKSQASEVLKEIQKTHPDAFIDLANSREIRSSITTEVFNGIDPLEYLLVNTTNPTSKLKNSVKSTPSQAAYYYIINLKTAGNLSDFDKIKKHPVVSKHALYISELNIDNRTWYQYRIGFFADKIRSAQVLKELAREFPLARSIRITLDEKQLATTKIRAYSATATLKTAIKPKQKPAVDADKIYLALVKKGTAAISSKDYKTAIQAFSELLSYPENRFSMDAQELLGFSYELNRQIANARNEYERYISLYPDSSGSIRIHQRLASLITARKATPKELREAKRDSITPKWETYGSISQFYRRDTSSFDIDTETEVTTINTTDKRVNIYEIDTILNINSRRRSNDYDIRTRFTGGYNYDLLDENTSNKTPLSEIYIDALDIDNKLYGRLGRQSSSKGGVLGRFDGLDAGYQASDWFNINVTTGYQVTSVYHSADTDTFFSGTRIDFGTFFNALDFSLYYIKQKEGDIVGREAVGTEFRYFHPRRSLFGLIDYDIMFDVTNTALINGTWTLASNTSINVSIDIRHSPILTAKNALQGQTFTSINDMLNTYSNDEILQIARDRTAKTKTIITGISHPFSDKYTLNIDLTATQSSATITSAGVEAIPATGTDYYLNSQLVGTSIFNENDTNITGISYSETDIADTLTVSWNYRIPATQHFRLNPRLSVAQRDNSNDTSQSIYGASFKMDYRWSRTTTFEFELGGETSDKTLVSGEEKNQVYFLNLGYQHSF